MKGPDLFYLYAVIIFLFLIQRIAELLYSKKNERINRAYSAQVVKEKYLTFMKVMHLFWFVTCIYLLLTTAQLEYDCFSIFYIFLLALGQVLRALSMYALKERWAIVIFDFQNVGTINTGIYRFLRHPNYLGVALEVFALPALLGNIKAAIAFSVINGIILFFRIKKENQVLY